MNNQLMNNQLVLQAPTCHKTCNKIWHMRRSGGPGGVGIAYLVNYKQSGHYAILLGKEKGGRYANTYNMCAGGVDRKDNGCYIAAARRESKEEVKINVDGKSEFDKKFKDRNGRIRFFMHNGTPIFIGVTNGTSRKDLNFKISQCNRNFNLPHCQREMLCVDYFWLSNKQQIEGKNLPISSFASGVISKIDINKL